MSLDDFLNKVDTEQRYENALLDDDLARVVDRVFPEAFWDGDVAPDYRQLVVQQFLERDGVLRCEPNNDAFVTRDQTRLYRARRDVLDVADVNSVHNTLVRMYDGPGEHEDLAERFLDDLKEVESDWEDQRQDESE